MKNKLKSILRNLIINKFMKKHTHTGVYAVIKKHKKLLLIKKARGTYTGKWDLPGSSFEFSETPTETLHREVIEETGQTIAKYNLLNVLSHTETYKNSNNKDEIVHHIGIIYRVKIDENNNILKSYGDGEDSLSAKWLEISSLNKNNLSSFAFQNI